MNRRRKVPSLGWGLVMLCAALAVTLAAPALADADSGWRLRVEFAVVDPSDNRWRSGVTTGSASAEFDTGAGVGIRGEYQFSRRVGIDFGLLTTASVGVEASASGLAAVDVETFAPLTVGADFHLTPDKRVDLYAGPQVALVQYDEVYVSGGAGSSGVRVSIDSDVGLGAILGLDVPLGEQRHWAFQTNLRYLATSMEGNTGVDRVDVDFDPTIFSMGFGYRW